MKTKYSKQTIKLVSLIILICIFITSCSSNSNSESGDTDKNINITISELEEALFKQSDVFEIESSENICTFKYDTSGKSFTGTADIQKMLSISLSHVNLVKNPSHF